MKTPTARYFQRREDYQPPTTPTESPFRRFDVKCLKCRSYQVRLVAQFDEEAGAMAVALVCQHCGQRESMAP